MKKSKKQEKRKRKLRTLILLLFLTIIMFGTSTYAWFTANKVVRINSIDVQVQAGGGIQISTDAKNWKSVITTTDIMNGYKYGENDATPAVNQLRSEVKAVSTNAQGNGSGRFNMYSAIIENEASSGDYSIRTQLETDTGDSENVGKAGTAGKYVVFDIFLRLDSQQTVYLTPDSNVVLTDPQETDRGLKNAARVAFLNLGHAASSTAAADLAAMNTSSGTILWEPNFDTHTSTVVNSVAPDYSINLTSTGTDSVTNETLYSAVPYRGVNAAISTAQNLKRTVNGQVQTGTEAMTVQIYTKARNNEFKTFVSNMAEGVTKYRVYMWIEGQDIDCENNATGSAISFKVQLSTTTALASTASSASAS